MKRKVIIIVLLSFIVAFFAPFIFFNENNSIFEILGLSFKAVATVASICTLIIAISLYNKFSVEKLVVERQTEKVLELVDLLKGKQAYIKADNFKYFVRYNVDDLSYLNDPFFKSLAGLPLVTRINDFNEFSNSLINVSNSYWMPQEIREKLDFLKISGYYKDVQNEDLNNYAKLMFSLKESSDDIWTIILPNANDIKDSHINPIKIEEFVLLINDFVTSKNLLIREIEKWLASKSNIKIDLKMDEPNQL